MYGKIILYKLNYPLLEVEFDALEVTKLLSEMSILFLKFGFLPKIYIYICGKAVSICAFLSHSLPLLGRRTKLFMPLEFWFLLKDFFFYFNLKRGFFG